MPHLNYYIHTHKHEHLNLIGNSSKVEVYIDEEPREKKYPIQAAQMNNSLFILSTCSKK